MFNRERERERERSVRKNFEEKIISECKPLFILIDWDGSKNPENVEILVKPYWTIDNKGMLTIIKNKKKVIMIAINDTDIDCISK